MELKLNNKETIKNSLFAFLFLFLAISYIILISDIFNKPVNEAQADPASINNNIYGWIWNDTIGWISLNSNSCDKDNNGYIDADCNGDNSTTASFTYGVNLKADNSFEGYAWSESLGYIKFDPSGAYPSAPLSSVRLESNKQITGWARICSQATDVLNCSGGSNGWLKMSCDGSDCATWPLSKGVKLDKANYFTGYAYNDAIGYISFSSRNCDTDGNGLSDACAPDLADGTPVAAYGAGTVTNVTGWAYNSNYGWISMNCADAWTEGGFARNACGNGFYGVNVDSSAKTFSGYGWSSNIGWVSFQETNIPAFINTSNIISHCDPSCVPASGCTACINGSNIYGWAKILSLGDDGWIRLDDDNTLSAPAYGVTIDSGTNNLLNWAWNEGTPGHGAGWIVFNCTSEAAGCAGHDYKVHLGVTSNSAPTAATGPVTFSNLCTQPLIAFLPWTYTDSDLQDGYQIQIKINGQPWSSAFNYTQDPNGTASQYSFSAPTAQFNTTYNWRVKVKDAVGNWSTDWADGADFTTPLHDYPTASFTREPYNPSAGENVQFTDTSTGYGVSITGWIWNFSDGSVVAPSTINSQNPIAVFSDEGVNKQVTLTATDASGYSCSHTEDIDVKTPLPEWIEKK